MISAHLERLIWEGKAKYKTHTIGTGSAQIEVANNKTIIVIGFDYMPFVDSRESILSAVKKWLPYTNKEIIISDKNDRYSFLARSIYEGETGLRGGGYHFSTYIPFINTFSLAIANVPSTEKWTIATDKAPATSELQRAPLSYGNKNTQAVVTITNIKLNTVSNSEIRPFRDTLPRRNLSYTKFQMPVDKDTVINNPVNDPSQAGQIQFPMITLHYVEINERLTNTFI